jgi:hypothetical protein
MEWSTLHAGDVGKRTQGKSAEAHLSGLPMTVSMCMIGTMFSAMMTCVHQRGIGDQQRRGARGRDNPE